MATLTVRIAAYVDATMPALRGARLVLAASGGADSAALVSLLCEAGIAAPARATIAHFDHRLRPSTEAEADRAAVRALAERYHLPLAEGAWDAPQRSEAAARDARYDFLADVARACRAAIVVTGHTRDDQAETVLMRAMRGAGLHGLAGIAPIAPLPASRAGALHVARPLLDVTRAATRAWCAARSIAFHEDSTNQDRAYARNRLRLDLLPALERAQPEIANRLIAIADHARAAAGALDAAAALAVSMHGAIARVDRAMLAQAPDLAAHAARIALSHLLGDARDYDRRHYDAIARAIATGATGTTLHLPRGIAATIDRDAVLLSTGPLTVPAIPEDLVAPLPFAGVIGAWSLRIEHAAAGIALPAGAVLRRRRDGDRVHLPSGHSRKLQDHLVDRRVPRRLRDATPVIATGSDVWWTPWVCAREAGRHGAHDRYAIGATIDPLHALGVPPPARTASAP